MTNLSAAPFKMVVGGGRLKVVPREPPIFCRVSSGPKPGCAKSRRDQDGGSKMAAGQSCNPLSLLISGTEIARDIRFFVLGSGIPLDGL